MKQKYWVTLVFTLVLLMALILPACSSPAPAPATTQAPAPVQATTPAATADPSPAPAKPQKTSEWPSLIGFATTGVGSSGHQMTVIAARMMTKYIDGVTVREVALAAPVEAIRRMHTGEALFTLCPSGTVGTTHRGIFGYEKMPVNAVFTAGTVYFLAFVLRDSGVKTFTDLRGKSFVGNFFADNNPTTRTFMSYLHAYGIAENDLTILKGMDHADMIRSVVDGTAVGCILPGTVPVAAGTELASLRNIDILGLDKDKLKVALEYGQSIGSFQYPVVLPANTYKGQTEEKLVAGGFQSYGVSPKAPEDLVYTAMKAIFDHEEEFLELQGGSVKYGLDGANIDIATPYHPGAIRYFKEKGLWTAENDAVQKQLIEELGPEFDPFGYYK